MLEHLIFPLLAAAAAGWVGYRWGRADGRSDGYADGLADAKQAADGTVSPSLAGGPGAVPR